MVARTHQKNKQTKKKKPEPLTSYTRKYVSLEERKLFKKTLNNFFVKPNLEKKVPGLVIKTKYLYTLFFIRTIL